MVLEENDKRESSREGRGERGRTGAEWVTEERVMEGNFEADEILRSDFEGRCQTQASGGKDRPTVESEEQARERSNDVLTSPPDRLTRNHIAAKYGSRNGI